MIIVKIVGLFVFLIGVFMMKYFPDMSDYQSSDMSKSGVAIGILIVVLGLGLLIFG